MIPDKADRQNPSSPRLLLVASNERDERAVSDWLGSLAQIEARLDFGALLSGDRTKPLQDDRAEAVLVSGLADPSDACNVIERLSGEDMIVIAIGHNDPDWQLRAFGAGAHDVIGMEATSSTVLLEKIRVLRQLRSGSLGVKERPNPALRKLQPVPIEFLPGDRDVVVLGKRLTLTPKEHELLKLFVRHPNECLSRDKILDAVWGIHFDTGTNLVDMYVYFVRKKLKTVGLAGVVETVRGRGYRFTTVKGGSI